MVLIVDGPDDALMAAGRFSADAIWRETDCFGADPPRVTMLRTMALGQRFRSASVLGAMEAAAVTRDPWRDGLPDLTAWELELVTLMVQALGDREIAAPLEISAEATRSRAKALRRKLGATTRTQVVARALQLGLARLGGP